MTAEHEESKDRTREEGTTEAPSQIVDAESLSRAVRALSARSDLICSIVTSYGPPPLWKRDPGFSSLVYAIIEQQVSLASARAVYERLIAAVGTLTAETFLTLDAPDLRSIGFSRQKIEYCRLLADRVVSDALDLSALERLEDEEIRSRLTALKGIGRWTVDVYLLHSLGRPDVWPVGDLALKVAVQEAFELSCRPDESELEEIGERFKPLRSVAARVFWQGYLSRRGVQEVT